MDGLLISLLQYGTTPALVVLSFVVGLLVKKIEENSKRDDERAQMLREELSKNINGLEEKFEERFVVHDKRMEELSNRISCVERDYLPREDHYKDTAGWRAELNRIFDVIIRQLETKK
jgi:fumarylacetoacetate (FAA) hydrolase family protein